MKYKTIFLCNHPEQVNYVYSPDRKARLAELTDLREGTVTAEEFANGGFSDVEIVFSTWGMPSLSEEELAKYLPNLKAVFYGAGATDAFVRPLLARGVKVLSAWQANAIPVAEFCVAQILLSLKGYFRNSREIHRTGDWQSGKPCIGPGVYGETVALIGAGAISTKVRELLQAFQINVVVGGPSRWKRCSRPPWSSATTCRTVMTTSGCCTGDSSRRCAPEQPSSIPDAALRSTKRASWRCSNRVPTLPRCST